jgi:excinuclease ABC subunit A
MDGIQFEKAGPNLFHLTILMHAQPVKVFSKYWNWSISLTRQTVAYTRCRCPWKGEKLGEWKEAFIRAAKAGFPVHKLMDLTPAMNLRGKQVWHDDFLKK